MDIEKQKESIKDISLGQNKLEKYVPELKADFIFMHRKTERLAAAVFLVTDLMSDTNPLKNKIRTLSVEILSFILVSPLTAFEDDHFTLGFTKRTLELLSFLEVSLLSEQISLMNYRLLSNEISRLLLISEKMKKKNPLEDSVSRTADILLGSAIKEDRRTGVYLNANDRLEAFIKDTKGHKRQLDDKKTVLKLPIDRISQVSSINNTISKSERRTKIMDLLRTGRKLSVKDFLYVIEGVSEKTIQRELISLVQTDMIKKEGDRRWSKYFLPIQNGESPVKP
ncbi:MAG: hypothetical protein A2664_04505 [Candidatus Taylorbacteria bacterium RIFCSPHIGHO2_01_FULL_46_22b]|uniref:HTH deoR-type domain-containing protein n=1 Tax=Candidatus Taylorbacteria bacterium RIFCSPHIGHO2_01_FULL_46_22b TaxID=1802301 RepID=A0A1G2M6J0_9BACT|nr:MAG: hypothetical protein A2664_04505 [Candidatus Taylorbacteria bacterium RIFCSPHIGHO2_01_FULL_46_22b]